MLLIACEWCGMSYDGDHYANCPHCLAPRSRAPSTVVDDGIYADGVLYRKLPEPALTVNERRELSGLDRIDEDLCNLMARCDDLLEVDEHDEPPLDNPMLMQIDDEDVGIAATVIVFSVLFVAIGIFLGLSGFFV